MSNTAEGSTQAPPAMDGLLAGWLDLLDDIKPTQQQQQRLARERRRQASDVYLFSGASFCRLRGFEIRIRNIIRDLALPVSSFFSLVASYVKFKSCVVCVPRSCGDIWLDSTNNRRRKKTKHCSLTSPLHGVCSKATLPYTYGCVCVCVTHQYYSNSIKHYTLPQDATPGSPTHPHHSLLLHTHTHPNICIRRRAPFILSINTHTYPLIYMEETTTTTAQTKHNACTHTHTHDHIVRRINSREE